ncbi:MAG: HNH endonuclease [Bacteroidia bacterium]
MNIRQLLLESEEIEKIITKKESIKLDFLLKSIEIDQDTFFEMLEDENIIIDKDLNSIISFDLLRQILIKEPEVASSPKNLRRLILANESLVKRLNQNDKEFIRVNLLCRLFKMKAKNLEDLFKENNITIEANPNFKIKKDIIKNLISKPLSNNTTREEKLESLNKSIIGNEAVYSKSIILNQFIRSAQVREYAKIRANGYCELCDEKAPFEDKFGEPYLESHHIIFLSRGGKDAIENVAALCPNCHRKIHNLNLQSDIKKLLEKRNSVDSH